MHKNEAGILEREATIHSFSVSIQVRLSFRDYCKDIVMYELTKIYIKKLKYTVDSWNFPVLGNVQCWNDSVLFEQVLLVGQKCLVIVLFY